MRGLSGMTCALPAWEITNVLNLPKLREHRRIQDDMEEPGMFRDGPRPEPEAARPTAEGASSDWRDPDEAAQLRDEMLRRTLNTPPMPRKGGKEA